MTTIRPPYLIMFSILPAVMPRSMILAVMNGIMTSIRTSPTMNSGVRMVSRLYCLICPIRIFSIGLLRMLFDNFL